MGYRPVVRAVLTIAAVLSACGTTEEQPCRPTNTKSRCDPGQKCTIDADGKPVCLDDDGAGRVEGEVGSGPEVCAAKLGCAETFGVSRCLRFCDPDLVDGDHDPCFDTAGPDRLNQAARCVARIPSQSFGVCVPPCELATGEGCPEGDADVRCMLPLGVPYAICGRTPGSRTAEAGQACGATLPCESGVCLRRGNGAVCREAPAEGRCGGGERSEEVPDSTDPLTAAPYAVCAPCAVLGQVGARWNQVCFTLAAGASDAARACRDDGAGLLRLDSVEEADEVIAQLAAVGETPWFDATDDPLGPDENGFWTSASRTESGWVWSGGTDPVDPALWVEGEPPTTGEAALLGVDGRLRLAVDGQGFPMCSLGAGRGR